MLFTKGCNSHFILWRSLLGPVKLRELHQRTGALVHPSYALPQLRAFYRNETNKRLAKLIEKWQSISSTCLFRWIGKPNVQMPMSYSEASWTGMLDFRTGCWDDEAIHLVETCDGVVQYAITFEDDSDEDIVDSIDLFPVTADFDVALPILREGIRKFNFDGSANSYWERWPELRSNSLNLFLGVGDVKDSHSIGFPSTRAPASEWMRLHHSVSLPENSGDRDVAIPPGLLCKRVSRDEIIVCGVHSHGAAESDIDSCLIPVYEE